MMTWRGMAWHGMTWHPKLSLMIIYPHRYLLYQIGKSYIAYIFTSLRTKRHCVYVRNCHSYLGARVLLSHSTRSLISWDKEKNYLLPFQPIASASASHQTVHRVWLKSLDCYCGYQNPSCLSDLLLIPHHPTYPRLSCSSGAFPPSSCTDSYHWVLFGISDKYKGWVCRTQIWIDSTRIIYLSRHYLTFKSRQDGG